jgi:hypothetical protein
MDNRNKRAFWGAALGIFVALLAGLAVTTYVTDVAMEINNPIIAEYGPHLTLEVSQVLQAATRRAAIEKGLRGRIARMILDNNGLGYPDVTPVAGRVWVTIVLVGAIIGACSSREKQPWAGFVAMVMLLLAINLIYDGSVALFTIFSVLVICAGVTYIVFSLLIVLNVE